MACQECRALEDDHHHGGHSHSHDHAVEGIPKVRLLQAMVFSLCITVAQVIGGIISGSLALLSDALHTATDAIALVVSFLALKLGERPGTERYTFGLKRSEIIAATLNAGILIGISVWLIFEAIDRFLHPQHVEAGIMVGVATVGLIANVINTFLLHKGAKANLNMRSAYLHVLSDAVVSIGVILGGVAILFLGWTWIDPALTLLISVWLIFESCKIVGQALHIIMMGAPAGIDLVEVEKAILKLEGVRGLHHLHLWQMNEQNTHFEAHVEVEDQPLSKTSEILDHIEHLLHDQFGINHSTIQLEANRCDPKDRIVD